MPSHKLAREIKAKADGALVQGQNSFGDWVEMQWHDFDSAKNVRIAPIQPADKDGWRPWFGGDGSKPDTQGRGVDIDFKNGKKERDVVVTLWNWDNAIRWRLHVPAGQEMISVPRKSLEVVLCGADVRFHQARDELRAMLKQEKP